MGDWNGDGKISVGLYDPAAATFYLTDTLQTGYAEYTFGYGVPGAGWRPLVGDWNGDGSEGVGLYDPQQSTFYLTNSLVTGFAEYTAGFGVPGAGWRPIVGRWTPAGYSSPSPMAKAVDEIDLASVAAQELSSKAGLDALDLLSRAESAATRRRA